MNGYVPAVLIGSALALTLGLVAALALSFRRAPSGKALIVTGLRGEPRVTFTGALVLPFLQRAELLDITVQRVVVELLGPRGVNCADGIRADLKASFFIRVNGTAEDVLKVARNVGCERAARQETLGELFGARFSEALRSMAHKLEFEQLFSQRDEFRDGVMQVIGCELEGFLLEDLVLDQLEQTPIECLDPANILDARGIRKLLEKIASERQAVSGLVLQRFEEAEVAIRTLAGTEGTPAHPSSSSRGAYRGTRAAAAAQVAALEKELARARRVLAGSDEE